MRRSLDRTGRRVAVEHAIAIGARLRLFNASLATKLGSALVETFDLEVFPRVTLTDKERADRLEDWCAACRSATSCSPTRSEVADETSQRRAAALTARSITGSLRFSLIGRRSPTAPSFSASRRAVGREFDSRHAHDNL
jgi:hypothetical protein